MLAHRRLIIARDGGAWYLFTPPPMKASGPQPPAGLSFFFPAYNDAGTIASLVIQAVQVASRLTPDFEVLVINDGSQDATGAIAEELTRTYPQVRVIHHPQQSRVRRRAADRVRVGDQAARSPIPTATRSTIPSELEGLWQQLTPDADMVTGYKISRSDPFHRIVIGRVYHHTVQVAVPAARAGRRLRLPTDAARDLRPGQAGARYRRDLSRDDAQDSGRRVPRHRGAGAPLSPDPRPLAVLQFPPHLLDRHRRAEAVDAARGPRARPSEHLGALPQSDRARSARRLRSKP